MLGSELRLCRIIEKKGQLVVVGCEVAVPATQGVWKKTKIKREREWNGGERGRESSRRKSGEGLGSEKAEWRLRKGRGYWDKNGFYTDRSRTSARQKSKGAKK